MNKTLRNIIVVVIVFIIVMIGFLILRPGQTNTKTYEVMNSATLPVLYIQYNDEWSNEMHGYTTQMDPAYMRESIIPLAQNRKLTLQIQSYGNDIKSVAYEVRLISEDRLIEDTEVDSQNLTVNLDTVTAQIELKNLLAEKIEYVLVFKVQTASEDVIYYYTRARFSDDTVIDNIVSLSKEFSANTLDTSATDMQIQTYMEIADSKDHKTLGYVDIKSTYDQWTWFEAVPILNGDKKLTILEMNETTASCRLSYEVKLTVDSESEAVYQVDEFYCWRYVNDTYYLLDYVREVEQQFVPSEQVIQDESIMLGVVADQAGDIQVQSAGNFTAFVFGGELWGYYTDTKELIRIYSFRHSSDDGVRTDYDQHDFRIVSLDETGNMDFVVYGYQNRGEHEGESGLVFYRYSRKENTLEEMIYIASAKPFQVLKEEVGTLSYIGDNGMFYLIMQNSLYAIDFDGAEYVVVKSNMMEGGYAISEDKGIVAWQEGESLYNSDIIKVMYLDTGSTVELNADEGESIRALGFLNRDFIYGKARNSEIIFNKSITILYPMYALEIMDENQIIQEHYENASYHIVQIEIGNDRISLERIQISEDGSISEAPSDALIQNAEESSQTDTVVKSKIDEVKGRVYYLSLTAADSKTKVLSISTPKRMSTEYTKLVNLVTTNEEEEDKRLYCYSHGELKGITFNMKTAVSLIYDDMGIILDAKQRLLWNRGNMANETYISLASSVPAESESGRMAASLDILIRQAGYQADAASLLAENKTPYEVLNEATQGAAVDLQGCTMRQILYYINNGNPVLVLVDGKAELIIGFDIYNLTIYDAVTGETFKRARDEAEILYEQEGYEFLSYIS